MKSDTIHKQWKIIGITLIAIILLIIIGSVLWWQFQSPVSSGLYVERESAYHLIEKDDTSFMDFSIPVVWVRSSPFDEHTEIENVSLIDDKGDEVFIVEESYYFLPEPEEDRRFNRVVSGKIELPLNVLRWVDDGGTTSMTLDEPKDRYRFEALRLTYKDEVLEFPLEDRYEVKIIEQQPSLGPEAAEMNGHSPIYDEEDVLIGFIYELHRVKGHELVNVHYRLPGMDEHYYERLQIQGNQSRTNEYMNALDGFEGEGISMPQKLDYSRILVYFPITDEIREEADKSILKIMPYFEMKKPDGETYFLGGAGQTGRFPRNTPWHELLIDGRKE